MKAFAMQEDCEGSGDIYYANHAIAAKKDFAREYNDGELSGITCMRAPWADQFAPGPCCRLAMINNGWWFECFGCGIRIDSDLEHLPGDPGSPVEELKPVADGHRVWCTAECRERDRLDHEARAAAEKVARTAIEARLLEKIPGVTIAGKSHVYVVKKDGAYVPQQCRVPFDFPGSKIGPANYGHDKVDEEPAVTVCAGDIPAWEAWRASLQPSQ